MQVTRLLFFFILLPFTLEGSINSPIINNLNVPVIINQPGVYVIAEDITYLPTTTGPMISVMSNNVTIDFLDNIVAQGNGVAGVTCVTTYTGFENILIKNGGFANFSQSAIASFAGTTFVILQEMIIEGCGNRVIEIIGTTAAPIDGLVIKDVEIHLSCTLATADNVLTLSNCTDSLVEHCLFHDNGSASATGPISHIKMTNCSRNILRDVRCKNGIGNADLRGFSLNNCDANQFNADIIGNLLVTAAGSVCSGYLLESGTTSTANVFQDCQAYYITGDITADGFLSTTGSDDNLFFNCLSFNNVANATTGVCCGFRAINNNRNFFQHCFSKHNTAPSSTVASPLYGAYGYKLDTTSSAAILQCEAADNYAATRGVGIGILGGTSANRVTQCFCARNGLATGVTTAGSGFGIDFQGTAAQYDTNAFIQNFSSKNTNGTLQYNSPGTGGGQGFTSGSGSNDGLANHSIAAGTAPGAWTNLGIT